MKFERRANKIRTKRLCKWRLGVGHSKWNSIRYLYICRGHGGTSKQCNEKARGHGDFVSVIKSNVGPHGEFEVGARYGDVGDTVMNFK